MKKLIFLVVLILASNVYSATTVTQMVQYVRLVTGEPNKDISIYHDTVAYRWISMARQKVCRLNGLYEKTSTILVTSANISNMTFSLSADFAYMKKVFVWDNSQWYDITDKARVYSLTQGPQTAQLQIPQIGLVPNYVIASLPYGVLDISLPRAKSITSVSMKIGNGQQGSSTYNTIIPLFPAGIDTISPFSYIFHDLGYGSTPRLLLSLRRGVAEVCDSIIYTGAASYDLDIDFSDPIGMMIRQDNIWQPAYYNPQFQVDTNANSFFTTFIKNSYVGAEPQLFVKGNDLVDGDVMRITYNRSLSQQDSVYVTYMGLLTSNDSIRIVYASIVPALTTGSATIDIPDDFIPDIMEQCLVYYYAYKKDYQESQANYMRLRQDMQIVRDRKDSQ